MNKNYIPLLPLLPLYETIIALSSTMGFKCIWNSVKIRREAFWRSDTYANVFLATETVAPIHEFLGGAKILYDVEIFFSCAVMQKKPYHHPLNGSQFMC